MKQNRRMDSGWGQYPELEEVAERGSNSAVASGLLLASLILALATSNLLACVFDQPRSLELQVHFDRVQTDHVSADSRPRSPRSTDQVPGRNT